MLIIINIYVDIIYVYIVFGLTGMLKANLYCIYINIYKNTKVFFKINMQGSEPREEIKII